MDQFISYHHLGLELVAPPLAHSCSFSGSIVISTQGPHRNRQTAQIFFLSHLILFGCWDLALKPARYVSVSQIHDGFFGLALLFKIKSLWSPMVTVDVISAPLLEHRTQPLEKAL